MAVGIPRGAIKFSVRDICTVLRERQKNKFDANFGVSGRRGNGKSTLLFHVFNGFKKDGFNQRKHQVYERAEVMSLLSSQSFGYCWDDEAINTAYKREFGNKEQQEHIKMVTNYRDSFNVYGSALPFFFSLDRDLRELLFMHIHIIERGLAVVFMQLQDQIHSSDPWDIKLNQKIEEQEMKKAKTNPNYKIKYERFSTFAGYLTFNAMTDIQEKLYLEIKHEKRARRFEKVKQEQEEKEKSFNTYIYEQLIDSKLTDLAFNQMCILNGKKPSNVRAVLSRWLKDNSTGKTFAQYLIKQGDEVIEEPKEEALAVAIPNF